MNRNKFLKRIVSYACMVLMIMTNLVLAPVSGTAQKTEGAPGPIYNNGPVSTGANSKTNVAAPAGFTWSELSTDNGGGNHSNTTLGAGCQLVTASAVNNRCADDFTVPAGQTWTINTVVVYGYQTNATVNPYTAANLRIWNGVPGGAGVTTIFGDTTTNRMGTVTDSTWLRIGNTLGGAGGVTAAPTNSARKIWRIPINVSPALVLSPGTYWIDFQLNSGANNFTPLISIPGARTTPIANSRQFTGTAWADLVDIGEPSVQTPPQPDVIPNVLIDFPFLIEGSASGGIVQATRYIDHDGDGKTDYSVVRSASQATQSTWHAWLSTTNGEANAQFGTGAGLPGGDRVVPADYDGDNRTDIAVWRPSQGAFYILQSNTSTIRAESFGQNGDDPTVVGDYDGNGTDDLAVYRQGATGQQGNYYYRTVANGPVFTMPWGLGGDVPLAGDFDGDYKADFHVARNESGTWVHYEMNSTTGFKAYPWGLSTDRLAVGDFDRDNRTDVCVIRPSGGALAWFVLKSSTGGLLTQTWGTATTDVPAPGDYDGDGRTDFAVWRNGSAPAQYFVKGSLSAPVAFSWGSTSDYPLANFTVR